MVWINIMLPAVIYLGSIGIERAPVDEPGMAQRQLTTSPAVAVSPSAEPATPALRAAASPAVVAAPACAGEARLRPLSGHELRQVHRQHRGLVQLCFRRAARCGSDTHRASVEVDLADRGAIRNVTVTAADAELRGCLERAVHFWRFPRHAEAQQLSFPIVFAH